MINATSIRNTIEAILETAKTASLAEMDAMYEKLNRLRKLTAGRDRQVVIVGMTSLRAMLEGPAIAARLVDTDWTLAAQTVRDEALAVVTW